MINRAIYQLPKRLMMVIEAKGAHGEFRANNFCVQMIIAVTFTVCLG